MIKILQLLFYILVFPGLMFSFAFGFLLQGIDRKVVARMQRRIGPPIIQPFYDFLKLLGKDNIIPRNAAKKAFIWAPIVGLVSIISIALFVPIFGYNFVSPDTADFIVIIYLLTIPALSLIIGGSSSGSPFAGVGISREMVTMLSYELPLVIILLAVGAKAGFATSGVVTFSFSKIFDFQVQNGILLSKWSMIPAAIAFLLIIPAEVGSVPFDVAEAETEICEGPLVEYSGFYLGIYKLTQGIKMFIMGSLFVSLFMGGNGFGNIYPNIVLLMALVILVIILSISFTKAVVARIKVEQTLRFFWTVPTGLALLSLILAYMKL